MLPLSASATAPRSSGMPQGTDATARTSTLSEVYRTAGVPPATNIETMKEAGTVDVLSAAEIVAPYHQGLPNTALDDGEEISIARVRSQPILEGRVVHPDGKRP